MRTRHMRCLPVGEHTDPKREAHFRQNIYFHKDARGNPIWKDTFVYAIVESDRQA